MKFKRKKIISFFFVAVFLVYVLSPLMFPCTGNSYAGIIPSDGKAAPSSKDLHIFFEKLICVKFGHSDCKAPRPDSEIIVHKSRTIIPEDKIIKLTRLYNLCTSENTHSMFMSVVYRPYGWADNWTQPVGFNLLSSGLSPPLV